MSRGINKVILIGNLGADPEVRALPGGGSVANLSLATSERWTDTASGEARERTEWHRVVLFGRLAEVAGEYLHSGSRVFLEGKLRTRQYQAEDGGERRTTEVVIDGGGMLLMLDSRPAAAAPPTPPASANLRTHARRPAADTRTRSPRARTRANPPGGSPAVPELDDAIPF